MSLSRASTALCICVMFGLMGRPYPGRVLKGFWCDSDNKNFNFLRFSILADISVLLILAIIKIWYYSHTPLLGLLLNIPSMHIGPREFSL